MDRNNTAMGYVAKYINKNIHFPNFVFKHKWKFHFFFDSDRLFSKQIIELVQQMLLADNSTEVCMCRLAQPLEVNCKNDVITIDRTTSFENYILQLKGDMPECDWLCNIANFGLASDKGNWCIYCEKGSEIAVLAIDDEVIASRLEPMLLYLSAYPIDEALNRKASFGFLPQSLSKEWAIRLMAEYA